MLEVLGVRADAVLVGVNVRFNPAVPSPAAFNHVMTRAEVDGKAVWLDATAEVAPYGMLLYATRDRSALVVPASGPAQVERTVAHLPFPAVLKFTAVGKLTEEGESDSKITIAVRGDEEVPMRLVLRQISPAQYDQLAKYIFGSIGYGGTATLETTTRPEETADPLTMSFGYKRSKAGDWDHLRTIPQLYPVTLPNPDGKEPVVESLALGVRRLEISSAAMTLPDGWGAELPQATHERSKWANYDVTYRLDQGVLYSERRVEVLEERVPIPELTAYLKFANRVSPGNEPYLQLVRRAPDKKLKAGAAAGASAGTAAEAPPAGVDLEGKTAEQLVADANVALAGKDLSGVSRLLDAARRKNAEQPGLWQAYGSLSFRNGEMTEAVKDYDKELALHPANVSVYPPLVFLQVSSGQRIQAEDSLRHWQEEAPNDLIPARQLAGLEMEDGHPDRAMKTAQAALDRTAAAGEKADEGLQLLLGRAQLKSGKKEDGQKTLLALMSGTDSPGTLNDAAYELGDAGLELPLAEKAAAKALDLLATQSQTWTLDENLQELKATTSLIEATWDTLGWILYREGKLDSAQSYVTAAWLGRQSLEVGKHAGEIAKAAGNKRTALRYFSMALATAPQTDALGVRKEPTAEEQALSRRVEELRREIPASAQQAASLQPLRTFALGAGADDSGDYKLLIQAQGVLRAESTSTRQVPDVMAKLSRWKTQELFPAGSPARLVLSGLVDCHGGHCELVLTP